MLPVMQKALTENPRKLFLFSHTKVGKTTLASALPNNLLIDCEDGSDFVDGIKYNLVRESNKSGKGMYALLKILAADIRKANQEKGDYVYDYITFDTTTGIEELAGKLATHLYKKTVMGRSFAGTDVVRELPNGAG